MIDHLSSLHPKGITYPYKRPPEGVDVLWRLVAISYSVTIDAEREIYGSSAPVLAMQWHRVTKRTPCGARIHGKFINLKATRQWACETEEKAIASFKARTEKHLRILRNRMKELESSLAMLP